MPNALRALIAILLVSLLASCGGAGRDESVLSVIRPQARPAQGVRGEAAQTQAVSYAPVTATDLAIWAQANYPAYFHGESSFGTVGPYSYRYYSGTGNFLGFAGSDVYVYGPVTGYTIVSEGTLSSFTCSVDPARCSPGAVRAENDSFSAPSRDSCRWSDRHSGGSSAQNGGLVLSTSAAAGTFSAARRFSQYSVKGDAQLEVTVNATSGFEPVSQSTQLYASFGLYTDDTNRFLIALAKSGANNVIRVIRITSTDGTPVFHNFPDIQIGTDSVRFRIAQSGPNATLQFDAGTGWITAATVPSFSDDAYVEMSTTAVGIARDFTATFRNFEVSSGVTSWRRYVRGEQRRRSDFLAGATGGDSMNIRIWGDPWGDASPFPVLKESGMGWYATDMRHFSSPLLASTPQAQWRSLGWHNEFWRSREVVAASLQQAKASGLRLYVQLLLSDQVAYSGLQRAPAAWAGRSVAETADLLRADTAAHVGYLKSQGLDVEVFALGNEIDLGVLDFLPGKRIPLVPGVSALNLAYLRNAVWPTEALLLKAAAEGVRSVYPNAKLLLHPAGMPEQAPSFSIAKAFFRFMKEQGVPFDLAGISHPYATFAWQLNEYTSDCWMQSIQELSDYNANLGKKTMIVEANYPRQPGAYSPGMPDFAYSDAGQASFVREHLRHGNNNPNMAGFLYFYADYFIGMVPDNLDGLQKPGLFMPDRTPTPALLEFGQGALYSP